MVEPALSMSGELADELAANDEQAHAPIDPRTIPLRNSHLKAMGRSPAHCRYSMLHDWEPTLAMRIGSAGHSLLLGGPPLVVYPGKVRNGKAWDTFKADNAGAIILSAAEKRKAEGMAAAVRADEVASRVLFAEGMQYETTLLWEQNGRARRCTPDAMNKSIIVDLKTTRDATPERFRWDAIRMNYMAQLADYATAFESVNGYPPRDCYLVAVEQLPPHGVVVWRLAASALERGKKLCREWFEKFQTCEASGNWPGYSTSVLEFEVPVDETDLIFDDEDDETAEDA